MPSSSGEQGLRAARLRGLVAAGSLVLLMAIAWVFWGDRLAVSKSPQLYSLIDSFENSGVPAFRLPDISGGNFSSEQMRGKVAIVGFWASWCNPCVEEFPSMVKLVEHFKGDVVLVAISSDEKKEDISTFLHALKLNSHYMHVLWDPDRNVANSFGVEKLPESFIVGREGKLIRKIVGSENWYSPGAISYMEKLAGIPAAP